MGTTTSKRPHDTTPTSTKVGAVQPASSTSPGRTNPVLGRSSDDGTEGSGDGVSTNVASGGAGGGSTAGGGTEPAPLKREDSTLAEQRALATDALSDDIGLAVRYIEDVTAAVDTASKGDIPSAATVLRLTEKINFVRETLRSPKLRTLIARHDEWLKLHANVSKLKQTGSSGAENELAKYLEANYYAGAQGEAEFSRTVALPHVRPSALKRFQATSRAVYIGKRWRSADYDHRDLALGLPSIARLCSCSAEQLDAIRRASHRVDSLEFDSLALHAETGGNALVSTMWMLLSVHDLFKQCDIPAEKASEFLLAAQAGYRNNPYHNAAHAADVAQTMHVFLIEGCSDTLSLSSPDVLSMLLAAAVHDLGHPGTNNNFSIAVQDEFAVTYNDTAVLENFHVAEAYRILRRPECDMLVNVGDDARKHIRKLMIAAVLGTDMTQHFSKLADFKSLTADMPTVLSDADRTLILTQALHCADISNPAKPSSLYIAWVERVMREFYEQGDAEAKAGVPISAFMDRSKPALKKCQQGFIDFIVEPTFKELGKLLPGLASSFETNLTANRTHWDITSNVEETQAVIDACSPTLPGAVPT